jgi:hypothetical protein
VKSEKIDLCIVTSDQWLNFKRYELKINERVRRAKKSGNINQMNELQEFADWVLKVIFKYFF